MSESSRKAPLNSLGVLVVEDSPDDEMMTLRALKRTGLNLNITVARDGAEALALLKGDLVVQSLERAPRLVLLDIKLPKLSGLQVLKAIRANRVTAIMPVVCLTSSDEISDTKEAYSLGVNSFVQKPIDYDTYMDHVAKSAEYWLTINYWPS